MLEAYRNETNVEEYLTTISPTFSQKIEEPGLF